MKSGFWLVLPIAVLLAGQSFAAEKVVPTPSLTAVSKNRDIKSESNIDGLITIDCYAKDQERLLKIRPDLMRLNLKNFIRIKVDLAAKKVIEPSDWTFAEYRERNGRLMLSPNRKMEKDKMNYILIEGNGDYQECDGDYSGSGYCILYQCYASDQDLFNTDQH